MGSATGFDVSVIVPTYNRANLIKETLNTILAQTHPPAEIIVVDDGSTDDTEAVVLGYGSPIRYHKPENGGPSRARNIGVSLARFPWIALCDSDDLWLPTKLERQIRLHTTFPDVEYSFTDFVFVEAGRWLTAAKFASAPSEFWPRPSREAEETIWIYDTQLYDRVLRFQPIFVSTLLISRDRYQRLGGYDETFSRALAEDFEFTLRNAARPPIGALAEPLVGIRRHPGNNSGNLLGVLLGEVRILEHALANHQPPTGTAEIIRDEIEIRRLQAFDLAFATGRLDTARELAPLLGPSEHDLRLRTKLAVARLPTPLAKIVQRLLSAARG